MYKLSLLLLAAGFVVGTLTGCGDDEPEGTTDAGTLVDSSASDSGTNDSGSSDSGTTDGGQDAGIVLSTDPVACGSTECQYTSVQIDIFGEIGVLPACCVDEATGECGADIESTYPLYMTRSAPGCVPFEQPGVQDGNCPTGEYELPALMMSFELPGCCLPSGTCGLWADMTALTVPANPETGFPETVVSLANFGCVTREDYLAEPGDPVDCEYVAPTE